MDTLHDRLAELAEDAPRGGAPAAELWVRGKRAYRLRAAALAATVLVVGAVGTGIGVRLADSSGDRDGLVPPARTVRVALPIEYPVGAELPKLGETPGPLAAIWVAPRAGGGAPEAIGLVAKTGTFGTLPIDVPGNKYQAANPGVALSPDGRRIAFLDSKDELVIHDLVSGAIETPTIAGKGLAPYGWIDADHLYGSASSSSGTGDADGWAWKPGAAPELVNLAAYPGQPYLGFGWPYAGEHLEIITQGPKLCASPRIRQASTQEPNRTTLEVPVLCDVVGVVDSRILLGHWTLEDPSGDSNDPEYAAGTVVALVIRDADRPYLDPALRGPGADQAFKDPARRRVVVTAGAPLRVTFATDLIRQALDADGGAS